MAASFPLLVHLNKIIDICVGNLSDTDIGKRSLPELFAKLENRSKREYIEESNYFMDMLKNEFKLLEQDYFKVKARTWGN